jgi:hypothetical protein
MFSLCSEKRSASYRTNGYTPNAVELDLMQECTSQVRSHAARGLLVGGLSALGVIKVLERRAPLAMMQKGIWGFTGCFIGFSIGASSAAEPCLKKLVSLRDSPMADTARTL